MGLPIGAVDAISSVEAGDDFADPIRPPDRGWGFAQAIDPALHQEFAEAVNVVRVQVGQNCRLYTADWKAHAQQVADAARAGVDNKNLIAGDNPCTGPGTERVGHGRSSATDEDVQAVRQSCGSVHASVLGGNPGHHHFGDAHLSEPQSDEGHRDDGDHNH